MENAKLSVLIPAYNAEMFLKDAIESVLDQTYKNFEIVILDDGSNDRTLEIAQEYQKRDSRIRVYSIENRGLSHARNKLVSLAEGEYIAFLDADDRLCDRFLEITYKNALDNEADVVACQYSKLDRKKSTYYFFKTDFEKMELSFEEVYQRMYSGKNNFNRVFVVAWGKLVKASLYKNIFYPNNQAYEDSFTTYKILLKAKKIVAISDKLYIYSVTPESLSAQVLTREKIRSAIEQHEERITLLTSIGIKVSNDNINDYLHTLKRCRKFSLESGFEDEYKWLNQKIDLIENHLPKDNY